MEQIKKHEEYQYIDLIKNICANDIPKIDHIEKTDKLCFGDSHSFGMYQSGYMCQRHDGLTMHGALKRGLDSYIYPWIKTLTCYMGNIDVRHHLMRQANPKNAVEIMMKNYESQLKTHLKGDNWMARQIPGVVGEFVEARSLIDLNNEMLGIESFCTPDRLKELLVYEIGIVPSSEHYIKGCR